MSSHMVQGKRVIIDDGMSIQDKQRYLEVAEAVAAEMGSAWTSNIGGGWHIYRKEGLA